MKHIPQLGKHKSNTLRTNKNKLRTIQESKRLLNDYATVLVYSNAKNQHSLVFHKGEPTKVSAGVAWHFDNTRVHWDIVCGCFCRDQKGKHYANYVNFEAVTECTSADISVWTLEACKKLFDESHNLHKLCPFFIAVPRSNKEHTDLTLALKTAHHYKVFNLIGSNFEHNVNKPFVDYHTEEKWKEVLDTFEWKYWSLNIEPITEETE